MLGEKIGGEEGHVTSQRVLANPGGGAKIETSFKAEGTLLGVKETSRATYAAVMRADGTIYGEGNGVVMGEGGEMATWVGQGVGTIKPGGKISYRGAIYYQTTAAKWTRLNSVAAVFEYETDMDGNTSSEIWEWK